MIALISLVLACAKGADTDSEPTDSPQGVDSAVDSAPQPPPLFQNPAEAVDQDPDTDAFELTLSAAPLDFSIGELQVSGYAYNGQVPGPVIRLQPGQQLLTQIDNGLEDQTTVHWHGANVPFEMDGVPWMSSPIQPGASMDVDFTLSAPFTGWYHPHFDTERQVDWGLYGVLIVQDPTWPTPDHELIVVADTWGESPDQGHHSGFVFQEHDWTVNGLSQPVHPVNGGESVLVRVVNVSNMGYLALSADTLRVVAFDQGLLPAPITDSPVVLGPGDRAVLELSPSDTDIVLWSQPWSVAGEHALGEPFELMRLELQESGVQHPGLDFGWSGTAPTADPGHTDLRYVFQGDEQTGQWRINGEAFPDVTIGSIPPGEPAIIEVRNLSATEHPFHLHGMHFEVLSIDGVAPQHQRIEDTLNLEIRQTVRLLVNPENAGDWMAHCHILPHAEGGMMTVLRVE
ncbi:MAG: multicopper oxidase family protein [Myxococcota bacterium]|nr:multicopper oxidase family protein [Myxococcota bacterium]